MPGFMQSIKSHLPLSPFSPTKKGAHTISPPQVMVTSGDNTPEVEQSSTEVLPGEALVSQNSSTVALTLTPANGEASHQLPLDEADVTPSEQLVQESDAPPRLELTSAESDVVVEPITETPSETNQTDALDTTEEVVPAADIQTEEPEVESAVVETVNAVESVAPVEPEHVETAQLQPEDSDTTPTEPLVEVTAAPTEEAIPAIASSEVPLDVAPPAPEVNAATSPAKPAKEGFSCNVKRSKSKKVKSSAAASTEATEAGESAPVKPRKSHPLSGKFRSVIEQVRSKVKKDKETLVEPPVVTVIEPMPACEETALAA